MLLASVFDGENTPAVLVLTVTLVMISAAEHCAITISSGGAIVGQRQGKAASLSLRQTGVVLPPAPGG